MNLIPRENCEFEDEFDTYVVNEGEIRIIARISLNEKDFEEAYTEKLK